MTAADRAVAGEGGAAAALLDGYETLRYRTLWVCEKWSEDACAFARARLALPIGAPVSSAQMRDLLGIPPEVVEERAGNLLLNEGIQRLLDLLIAAGGTAYNNANSYIGVGDSTTAEAASQTELQAATNRFYKAMNATFPSRAAQTVTWQSDFTSGEANYAWQESSLAAGATTASGSGFTTGTTNLNRKVQSLGTKVTGTWTLATSVTIS